MDLRSIVVHRCLDDYYEVVEWCHQHFAGGNNGRYDVVEGSNYNLVNVYLTPYTEEAATLITLKWLP